MYGTSEQLQSHQQKIFYFIVTRRCNFQISISVVLLFKHTYIYFYNEEQEVLSMKKENGDEEEGICYVLNKPLTIHSDFYLDANNSICHEKQKGGIRRSKNTISFLTCRTTRL